MSDHSQHHDVQAPLESQLSLWEKINDQFSQLGFMPHGHCYLWKPLLVSIHVVSDFLIGTAYIAISITLYGIVKRIQLPFNRMILAFGVFIGACGMTHYMEIWNLWNADYWWSAWVKVITAMASVATGLYLYRIRHTIITVAEAAKLAEQRRLDLETLTQDLEMRIEERTNQLAESESKFRTITEAMPQMVWTADPNGKSEYYNSKWLTFTGTTPVENQVGSWLHVIHPDDKDQLVEAWQTSVASGDPYEKEFRMKNSSGEYRWVLGRALAVRNSRGDIIRWMGTCTDIHDQKMLQEDLKKAIKARDQFLGMASHELKTPVTTLKLQIQLNQRNLSSTGMDHAKSVKFINILAKQTDRIQALVEDMLDVSRLQAGALTYHFVEVELSSFIRDVLERFKPSLDMARIPLMTNFEGGCEAKIDPDRFEQVVVNILGNATKYAPEAELEVSVRSIGSEILLVFRDQGPGIPSEKLQTIFDRYERATDDNLSSPSGLGLGLFISRKIVENHGGKMWAESQPGGGTTFFITIHCL